MNSLSWQLSCFLPTVPPSPLRVPLPAHLAAFSRWFWPGTPTPVPRGRAQFQGDEEEVEGVRGPKSPSRPTARTQPHALLRGTKCRLEAQRLGSMPGALLSLQPLERLHHRLGPTSRQHMPIGLEELRDRLPQRRRGYKPRSRGDRSSGRRVRSARCRHRHGPQAGQGRRGGRLLLRGDRSEELGDCAGVRPVGGGESEGRPRGAWNWRGEGRSGGPRVVRGTPCPPPEAALGTARHGRLLSYPRVGRQVSTRSELFINCWTTGVSWRCWHSINSRVENVRL